MHLEKNNIISKKKKKEEVIGFFFTDLSLWFCFTHLVFGSNMQYTSQLNKVSIICWFQDEQVIEILYTYIYFQTPSFSPSLRYTEVSSVFKNPLLTLKLSIILSYQIVLFFPVSTPPSKC